MFKAFAEMLDLEPTLDLGKLKLSIKNKLEKGIKATRTIDDFTPLMLYATFNVLDRRFDEALVRNCVTKSTYLRGAQQTTSRRVNALSCAVFSHNLEAIKRLLNTNQFSEPGDYEVALELSALTNFPAAIPIFAAHKCNLFTFFFFPGITPLMYACRLNHIEVVREILLTNPDDESLNISSLDGLTASKIVLNSNNEELITLFSDLVSFQRELLIRAIKEKNIEKVQSILSRISSNANILTYKINRTYNSTFAAAIIYSLPLDNFGEKCINEFENNISQLSIQEKINTLLLTCSILANILACSIPANDNLTTFTNKYLQELSDILDNRDENEFFNQLIMPMAGFGFDLPSELWTIIRRLINDNVIEKIDFSGYCPDVHDDYAELGVCTVNLSLEAAVPFVDTLIDNTSITQCDLRLPTVGRPLMRIVEIICERNTKIAQVTTSLVRDKIYNTFVDAINNLIEEFKTDSRVPQNSRGEIKYLHKKSAVYTLVELSAFSICNNPSLKVSKNQLPVECRGNVEEISKFLFDVSNPFEDQPILEASDVAQNTLAVHLVPESAAQSSTLPFSHLLAKLENKGVSGQKILDVMHRLYEGQTNCWNPYWMNSGAKLNRIIQAVEELPEDADLNEFVAPGSRLYNALNMQRIMPITFFGKLKFNQAKSLISVQNNCNLGR